MFMDRVLITDLVGQIIEDAGFEPQKRSVDEARDRESGGAGLGLAIADRVMRIHGGTIHAENAHPQGLKVIVEIPAAESTSAR